MMISNSIKIIPMQKEHIKDITELERQCFSEPWSENALSEELSNTCAVFFAAIVDNILVGYIGMHNICSQGYITNIAVFKQYRRKGIAGTLLQKIIEYALDNNMEFVSLEVRKSNMPAISLYIKYGFKEMGIRKKFYSKPCEDAVIMTRYFVVN